MITWLQGILQPEAYHGLNTGAPFFEGWYHKLVTQAGNSFAIIPGVYRSAISENEFSFIMVFDGETGEVYFERYEISSFSARVDRYDVSIEQNRFYYDGLDIDIKLKVAQCHKSQLRKYTAMGFDVLDNLEILEVAEPRPKRTEVIVKIEAVSLNPVDIKKKIVIEINMIFLFIIFLVHLPKFLTFDQL